MIQGLRTGGFRGFGTCGLTYRGFSGVQGFGVVESGPLKEDLDCRG